MTWAEVLGQLRNWREFPALAVNPQGERNPQSCDWVRDAPDEATLRAARTLAELGEREGARAPDRLWSDPFGGLFFEVEGGLGTWALRVGPQPPRLETWAFDRRVGGPWARDYPSAATFRWPVRWADFPGALRASATRGGRNSD